MLQKLLAEQSEDLTSAEVAYSRYQQSWPIRHQDVRLWAGFWSGWCFLVPKQKTAPSEWPCTVSACPLKDVLFEVRNEDKSLFAEWYEGEVRYTLEGSFGDSKQIVEGASLYRWRDHHAFTGRSVRTFLGPVSLRILIPKEDTHNPFDEHTICIAVNSDWTYSYPLGTRPRILRRSCPQALILYTPDSGDMPLIDYIANSIAHEPLCAESSDSTAFTVKSAEEWRKVYSKSKREGQVFLYPSMLPEWYTEDDASHIPFAPRHTLIATNNLVDIQQAIQADIPLCILYICTRMSKTHSEDLILPNQKRGVCECSHPTKTSADLLPLSCHSFQSILVRKWPRGMHHRIETVHVEINALATAVQIVKEWRSLG